MSNITAIIPVRAGSRRLKNKNMLPFDGVPLLVRKIQQLKEVQNLDDIVVSSDSDEMLEVAKKEGASIHKREQIYADDVSVPFGEVVKNICEHVDSENILWATCTSPMTLPVHYQTAIDIYKDVVPEKNDSLVAFEILKLFLWNDNGPINYELGTKHVISQNLPNIYRPTNGIFIAPREKMIEWKYFHGKNPYKYILDKMAAVDIDDGLDLACAKAYLDYSFSKSI